MKKIEIIFTGALEKQSANKILKQYPDIKIKQFNLLKFSGVINNENVKEYYDTIDSSSIVCITSKKTIEIIKQYKDLFEIMLQKKIVVSGEKVASFIKDEVGAEVIFSKQHQGQNGVVDVLSRIATKKDLILYLHSSKAERKINDFLISGKFIGHCKEVYKTSFNETSLIELLNYINNDKSKKRIVFFASPSAVHAYREKIISTYDKNINYIAFGQSTKDACDAYKIECFFDKNCKNYVDSVVNYLVQKF